MQIIKSAIDLVNNRPFGKEISKISEQNLYGVKVISDERYVSRVEVQTKEDLKDVAEAGISLTPPGRIYTYGKYGVDLVKDLKTGNFENTINNGIGRIIPRALRKIGVSNKASEIIPEAVSLGRDLNDN